MKSDDMILKAAIVHILDSSVGVPVLSMHAPWEVVGKLDCYMTMKACRAFYGME